jgi:hypothetical protein
VEWIQPGDNSGFQINCGLRVQGSDYQRPRLTRTSKFSFRLYFRGDYGPGRLEYPLFPLTQVQRFDQLVLRAGYNEQGNPFIRDEIHRRLSHDMGEVASHGTIAIVLVNGVYYGSSPWYNPCERVHEEFLQEHLGGGDEWDVVGPSFAMSAGSAGVIDGDRANFLNLVNYVRTQSPVNSAVYTEIGRRLDLTNFVDYCLLNAYAATGDWPANNWRAGRERGTNGIWRFVVWDAEWGMGIYDRTVNINSFSSSGGGPNDSGLASVNNSEIARIYDRLRASPEFRLLWADRVQKHFFNNGALTGGNISNRFEQLRQQMAAVIPNMDREILQWARDRQNIFFGQLQLYGLLASSNAPVFAQFGGRIPTGFALANTTNGSDPRVAFTGEISPAAGLYETPVPLAGSTLVRARSLQGTNWSAISEATFSLGALDVPLRITEVMYNPTGGSPFEFIELQNTGATPLNVSGFSLDGITFTFNENSVLAAGQIIVLGENTDTNAWRARYLRVVPYGWFGGNLNNAGERLTIYDGKGNIITSVDYRDSDGWPVPADGSGASLEVRTADGDADDPANWQASGSPGGSPGLPNPTGPVPLIYLSEIMAANSGSVDHGGSFPDWIELHNPGDQAVNLSGWSVDDADEGHFTFPVGTEIAPGSYLLLWGDAQTNTTPGFHAGFSLDPDGDGVFLYDAQSNRVDAVTFGQQLTDYTLARHTGTWKLSIPTPDGPNRVASVGRQSDLAINEWMANPVPGDPDWVELFNRSALPVAIAGIHLATSNGVFRVPYLSYIGPSGFIQLIADESAGADHLDFKLPAAGGTIALYDDTGGVVDSVIYGTQLSGLSQGRLPDGNNNSVVFIGSASPGAPNYAISYGGPMLNEVLARNRTSSLDATNSIADYIELYYAGTSQFNIGGFSLSLNEPRPGQWVFPPNTMVPPLSYMLVRADPSRPVSVDRATYNLGQSLDDASGSVYLFDARGQIANFIEYGFQITDSSIGKVGSQWQLLSFPTPGRANTPAALLAPSSALRLNEWMPNPALGADWFELFNSSDRPVDLSGVSLTDDPSIAGRGLYRVAPLSFIGPGGFVKWVADSDPGQGRNHVNFSLDAEGESLLVYSVSGTNYTRVHAVAWGATLPDASEGFLPDGSGTLVTFPQYPTPGASNVSPLTDSDLDGIPDAAEVQMGLNPNDSADGLADTDADGASNAQEYLAGTGFRDPLSSLRIMEITVGAQTTIKFAAVANRSYSVLYTDSLAPAAWRKLADLPARAADEAVSVIDAQGGNATRFYRVVTPAQ